MTLSDEALSATLCECFDLSVVVFLSQISRPLVVLTFEACWHLGGKSRLQGRCHVLSEALWYSVSLGNHEAWQRDGDGDWWRVTMRPWSAPSLVNKSNSKGNWCKQLVMIYYYSRSGCSLTTEHLVAYWTTAINNKVLKQSQAWGATCAMLGLPYCAYCWGLVGGGLHSEDIWLLPVNNHGKQTIKNKLKQRGFHIESPWVGFILLICKFYFCKVSNVTKGKDPNVSPSPKNNGNTCLLTWVAPLERLHIVLP